MSKYRNHLPQMNGDFFLTDGGLEKALVFRDGIELPHFAAFVLMETKERRADAELFWSIDRNRASGWSGLILETPTCRTNTDWARRIGY